MVYTLLFTDRHNQTSGLLVVDDDDGDWCIHRHAHQRFEYRTAYVMIGNEFQRLCQIGPKEEAVDKALNALSWFLKHRGSY